MFYIDTDNIVKVVGLRDAETREFINGATVTGIVYKLPALNPDAGNAAVNVGVGLVGIICAGHGLDIGDCARIERTLNYNDEYVLQAGTNINMLVISASYVYEVFDGSEYIYPAFVGTIAVPIPFHHVTGSDGDYVGKVPYDAGFIQDESYVICIKEASGLEQVLAKIVDIAGFLGL